MSEGRDRIVFDNVSMEFATAAGPLRVVATRNSQRFYERHGFVEVGRDAIERGEPIVRIEVIEMKERDS